MKMEKPSEIIIGSISGLLTITQENESERHNGQVRRMITVRCFCGVEKKMRYSSLKSQGVKTCGAAMCRNIWLAILKYNKTEPILSPRPSQVEKVIVDWNEIKQMELDCIEGKQSTINLHIATREKLEPLVIN